MNELNSKLKAAFLDSLLPNVMYFGMTGPVWKVVPVGGGRIQRKDVEG
jgi:hypothetical protein